MKTIAFAMKLNSPLIYIIMVINLMIIASCNEKDNESPSPSFCKIDYPKNNQEIAKGDTITISVTTNLGENIISQIIVIIDDTLKNTITDPPYTYTWVTNNEIEGNHSIMAICTDNNNYTTTDKIDVLISENIKPLYPISNFSYNTNCGTAPTTVNFIDRSLNNPTHWYWDFGDGSLSTMQNPTHTYTDDGYYSVSLIVNNDIGSDTTTKNKLIYIGNVTDGSPCPETPIITDEDGNNYNTVFIGGQCWMKENLRVGDLIQGKFEMNNDGNIEKYCYDNLQSNCDEYGALYQWDEIMQYAYGENAQGICPDGWHIPSDDDWIQLEMHLGISYNDVIKTGYRGTNEGRKLKSEQGWNSNGNGSNESKFSALPGGYHYSNDKNLFRYLRSNGSWWSSSKFSDSRAWRRGLYDVTQMIRRNHHTKTDALSVRCIKD